MFPLKNVDCLRFIRETRVRLLVDIINMMQSPFLSVRTKATHLVGQFCQTNAIFDFMVTNGTIDKLTAINKSSHLKTALSEETHRSILEYNYSSKFAHFDKLNNTEKIDHLTFYECGTDSFDTLEGRVIDASNLHSGLYSLLVGMNFC